MIILFIFQFKNRDLLGVAFIDSQIYIHSLCTMKSFILVGDVMKSIDLLQFQQDYRTLAVISKDPRPLEVYSIEFVIDNNTLAFAVTDADKNLNLYMYQVIFQFQNKIFPHLSCWLSISVRRNPDFIRVETK